MADLRHLSVNFARDDEEDFDSAPSSERDLLLKDPMGEGSQEFAKKEDTTRLKRVHRLLNLVGFVLNMEYSIILPTLFFYVERLNEDAVMYGWIAASFSIASFVATFLYGHWVDRRPTKEPLAFGMLMMTVGTALYGLGFGNIWVVLGGRVLAGFGGGTVATLCVCHVDDSKKGVRVICLNYFVRTTTMQERTQAIANFYAIGMVGMVIAPGVFLSSFSLSLFFAIPDHASKGLSLVLHLIDFEVFGFKVDEVTLPGYIMCIVGIVVLVLILVFIYDPPQISDARGIILSLLIS